MTTTKFDKQNHDTKRNAERRAKEIKAINEQIFYRELCIKENEETGYTQSNWNHKKEINDLRQRIEMISNSELVEKSEEISEKKLSAKDINDKLRIESGQVNLTEPFTILFYDILRDGHIAPGVLEQLVRDLELSAAKDNTKYLMSNGWLAKYAENLSNRIYGCGLNSANKEFNAITDEELELERKKR